MKFLHSLLNYRKNKADMHGQLAAISRAQAVIEFALDGTILTANENFCRTMGYELGQIKGQHHRLFVEPRHAASAEYRELWARLNRGEFDAGQYKRIAQDGREVWIQATYNPIFGVDGKPFKVVKYATDITRAKLAEADSKGQLDAVSKAQAVIEFALDGTIVCANDNFCRMVGYSREELAGKHHSMLVTPEERGSAAYQLFWDKLARGRYDAGQYKRVARDGREVWIQASYNPILDTEGRPFKVVKYATDITAERLRAADFSGQIAAIHKAQAVIEFNLDGTIRTANEKFCAMVGYSLDELRGRHHGMLAEPEEARSAAYAEFWQRLARGEYQAGQFKRLGRGGRTVWIQASYNPILDLDGRPFKVVKISSDITEQMQGVQDMGRILGALAEGDLTEVVATEFTGSFKQVKDDANTAMKQLTQLIGRVKHASDAIRLSSLEIAQGNSDLSSRVELQAASLVQTADAIATLVDTIRRNAESARQGHEFANSAKEIAANGGRVVDRAVETMGQISASARRIVDIIGVIDGIAFQTNILALNAGVEAARAGDHGRGFGVVAAEVRSLAQRSAAASKEIKSLITESVQQVQAGTDLVGHAGRTMTEVVDAIRQLSERIEQVSTASADQSRNVAEVDRAMREIDEVTRRNAAVVEQTSSSTQAMHEQAERLTQLVGAFKLHAPAGNDAAAAIATAMQRPSFNGGAVPRREARRDTGARTRPATLA